MTDHLHMRPVAKNMGPAARRKRQLTLIAGLVLPIFAQPAFAQNADGDIVVTAQRREERLQSVPIAISVVTGAVAERSGIKSTDDLNLAAPGLTFTRSLGAATPFLRGVGTLNSSSGDEPSVATYVDGIYYSAMPASVFALANVERIEVLRGPQGTLFGRNASGGVIQIVTKKPSQTPELRMRVGYGNYKTLTGTLYGNTPLGEGIAADVSGYYSNQRKGFGRNLFTGNDLYKGKQYSIRSSVLMEPSDDTEIRLSGDYNLVNSSSGTARRALPGSILSDGVTGYQGFFINNENLDPYTRTRQWGVSLHARQSFDAFDLVSITAYRDLVSTDFHDQDGTPAPRLNLTIVKPTDTFSQELQVLSQPGSKISWIIGGYYLHSIAKYDPSYFTGTTIAPRLFRATYTKQNTRSLAIFGQATAPVTDHLNLTLGARYTSDRRILSGRQETDLGVSATYAGRKTYKKFTFRTSADYKFTDNLMAYASFNRGFKSGVYNLTNGAAPPVAPETLDAYEVGFKSNVLDRLLQLNVAAFHYDYKNIQLTQVQPGGTLLLNAARARINGAEIETVLRPSRNLSVNAGLSVLDAKYTDFPNAPFTYPNPATCNSPTTRPSGQTTGAPTGGTRTCPGDASGLQLARAPKMTLSLGADYTQDLSFGQIALNASYYYNDGFPWEPDGRLRQKHYQLVNSRLAWTDLSKTFTVGVWANNLFNEKYLNQANSGNGDQGSPADPRTYGVTVEVHF